MRAQVSYLEIEATVGLDAEVVRKCVQEGWIKPVQEGVFDEEDISRLLLIRDLTRDLGIENEAIPVILNLVDQIHFLKAALQKGGAAA